MVTAIAHPNIALIKYWGKQDKPGNIPATPNMSITLDTLSTETTVTGSDEDVFYLNGQRLEDNKVTQFLAQLRSSYEIGRLSISSTNNFPTGAGLASSASGFAALTLAINKYAGLGLSLDLLSAHARLGSASAARSFHGGFVSLVPPLWQAQATAPASHWPLSTVIAITSHAKKTVGSSAGMEASRLTSPFYEAWLQGSADDYANANEAILAKDFQQLAAAAELNCLKMHSVMLTSVPTLSYWNPTTLAVMDEVRNLRNRGIAVFFTIDAGPQVKAVCLPENTVKIAKALSAIEGVQDTMVCQLGPGAHLK